jgi:hypothetical protein
MDKDTDERLLPDGVYRHAENVLVTNSEAHVGSVQNYSNKKLTSIDFGDGIILQEFIAMKQKISFIGS